MGTRQARRCVSMGTSTSRHCPQWSLSSSNVCSHVQQVRSPGALLHWCGPEGALCALLRNRRTHRWHPTIIIIVAVTYTVGFAKRASWCGGIVWASSSGPPCVSRAPGETGGKGSEPRWGGVTLKRPQLPACAACWPFGERASWDLGCMNYLLKRFSCNARLTLFSSGSRRTSSAFRDDVRGDTRRAVGILRYL